MQIPHFTKGEIIRASDLNKLGNLARDSYGDNPTERNSNRKNLKPFDIITSYINDNNKWEFKINIGYCYNQHNVRKDISIGTPDGDRVLSAFPAIELYGEYQSEVYKESNLVYNYETNRLGWQAKDQPYNILIIEPKYLENGDIILVNKHPFDIDIRNYPPLTEILVNNGSGSIKVGATLGKVIERVVTDGDCVISHDIDGLEANNDVAFYDILPTQQFSVIVETTDKGVIAGTPPCYTAIETNDTASVHYQPEYNENEEGTPGVYHYPIIKSGGASRVIARSHIEYDEDIDSLHNANDPATAVTNEARIIKKWDEATSQWVFRRVRRKGNQITVSENTDHVEVGGNGVVGSAVVKVNGVDAGDVLNWDDGLITDNQNIVWNVTIPALSSYSTPLSGGTGDLDYKVGNGSPVSLIDWTTGMISTSGNNVIPIPALSAGQNITISETNNVFTISSTASLSGTWMTVWLCVDGTPTEKQIFTRDVPT